MMTTSRNLRIVVLGGLGDCLLHTPFIRHFRVSGAYDRIACMVQKGTLQLFDHNPYIDLLVGCPGPDMPLWALPEEDCDVFSPNLHAELRGITRDGELDIESRLTMKCRSGWATARDAYIVRQIARRYGIELSDESLDLFTAPEDDEWAAAFTGSLGDRPTVALNRRSAMACKEYPQEHWQIVADALAEQATVVEFGPPTETLAGVRPIWPFQPLRRTAALLRRISCLVTVDSFLAHVAAAVGTPAIVVFGPTNPAVFGHPVHVNIRRAPCEPCYNPDEAGCRQHVCLTELPPDAIIAPALSILAAPQPELVPKLAMPMGARHVRQ